MPIWDRLKDEFERAGRAASSAIDEGKLRLDLMRARQNSDRAAERLGYALFKAKEAGFELSADDYNRHASELSAAQAEITRLETLLKEAASRRGSGAPESAAEDGAAEEKPEDTPPAA